MKVRQEIKWWRQRVKNVYHLARSIYWVTKCGHPAKKLTVIGVTGTDGKTTTCSVLYEVMKAANLRVGMLTTVSARFIEKGGNYVEIETGLHTTNPDAALMQPILTRMVNAGVTHLILEVTAHGIDQHRIFGTNIQIGVLTNITHEHLDDFVNMERYKKAKLKMFKGIKWAVLNANEPVYGEFAKTASEYGARVVGYKRVSFKDISPTLVGEYNKENLGAVSAVAKILGIPEKTVKDIAKTFSGVSGRREEVLAGQNFRVIVDFAHTPNALEKVLRQLKEELPRKAKLIVVFGCTGERDREKRPKMGRAAVEIADRVIITSDDTRSESQDKIYQEIMEGVVDQLRFKVEKENDRKKAIELAFAQAEAGDIILLAGKGHEKTILINGVDLPWSDKEAALELLGEY